MLVDNSKNSKNFLKIKDKKFSICSDNEITYKGFSLKVFPTILLIRRSRIWK